LIPASCRGLREPACKTTSWEDRVPASLGRRGYAELRDPGDEMRCIEEDELEFGERKGSRLSKIMAFVPLSFSRSSASANSSVSLALVISIISYLHHAKSRNLPTAASPADAHKSCRCHEELCRHGWQRPSDALISTRDFLRLCTAAFFPKRRTCIQPP